MRILKYINLIKQKTATGKYRASRVISVNLAAKQTAQTLSGLKQQFFTDCQLYGSARWGKLSCAVFLLPFPELIHLVSVKWWVS